MSQTKIQRKLARLRPTIATKFNIDYEWWEKSGRNFRLYLLDQLCEECRSRFNNYQNTEDVDWVDPTTGEVHRTDALRECLRTECATDPEYINEQLPLSSACFRIFLANNNAPLSPQQLSQLLPWRSPENILRTLGGRNVYMGLRPAR